MLFVYLKLKRLQKSLLWKRKTVEWFLSSLAVILLWLHLIGLAIFLPKMIDSKGVPLVSFYYTVLLVYFFIDLGFRFMFYRNISIDFRYLALHTKKSTIKWQIVLEKILGVPTLTYGFFFLPLTFILLFDDYGLGFCLLCLATVFLCLILAALLVLSIKILSSRCAAVTLFFYSGIGFCLWMTVQNNQILSSLQNQPATLLWRFNGALLVLTMAGTIWANHTLNRNLYLDN